MNPEEIKSEEIKSEEIKSEEIKSEEIKSEEIKSNSIQVPKIGKVAFVREGVTIMRDVSMRAELEKSGWSLK